MAVRSLRVAAARIVTPNVFTTVYTVPADRTLIVRTITLQNQGAAVLEATVRFRNADTGGLIRVFFDNAMATQERRVLEEWTVLEEGDSIEIRANGLNVLNYWISGSLLFGDPS